MDNQALKQLFSKQQGLLKQLQVSQRELAKTDQDATERWADVLRHAEENMSAMPRRRTQVKQFKSSLTRTENLLSELANKVDEECERKEVALKEAKESEDFYQGTSTALSVHARIANDEIAEGRKMAVDVMQAVNTGMAKCLIDDALRKKNRREKSKQQQLSVEIRMVGSIDDRPWATAFKSRIADSDDWGEKMKCELSIWESLVRNPEFCPFTTIRIGGSDKWEKQIDHHNEKLSFLKKSLGEEVYNSVTTALMEIEQYNSSGRYPIPLPWILEESRMATLKEVIAHLGSIVDAFVGAAPPAKRTRANARSAKDVSCGEYKSKDINLD